MRVCLLALALAIPAGQASAHAFAVDTVASEPLEVVSGTVVAVRIDNLVNRKTSVHRELRLDGAGSISLRGAAAEGLMNGGRVRVAGRRTGSTLEAMSAEVLSTSAASSNSVQIEGTLAIAHADDFANNTSRYAYEVHADTGSVTALNVSTLPSDIHGGSRVIVRGKPSADGSSLDPETITVESDATGDSGVQSGLVAKLATTNTVLVILANFNNTAAPAYTATQALQVMQTNSDSVANYYSEASYGSQLMNVTVTSTWVTMNLAASCSYTDISTYANAAAQALNPLYTASNYNYVVYLFPSQGCGWAGLAYVGYPHLAFINGTGAFATQVVAHEMGHNFGLWHAGSLNCGTAAIGGSCNVSEYGDPWDTMGNQRAMHFNAMQKSRLGWIPPSSVMTHSSGSASYTLSPLETPGGSVYAVKVPTSNANRTYWVEFRQPIGFDAALASYPTNGAQVRVANPFEWTFGSDDTQIVDMTPGSGGGFGDSALVVGQSYLDSTYGVNIIVTGATASALTVSVSTAGGAATTTALASSANPSAAGSTVTFTATVTGSSPTGSVNFKDGATSISGCGAVALSGSGNTRTAVCATSALTAGTHSIVAIYGGDGSNTGSSSSTLSQTINGVNSTTGIATSLTPSTVGTSVTFTATVSGTSPTGTVNFKDGSTSISGCSAASVSGSGNIRTATCTTSTLAAGSHSVSAAYSGDATNTASTSGTLTQTVNKVSTSTALASSANPSTAGSTVSFTATVTGSNPTGSVNFTDGGSSISGCGAVAVSGSGNTRTAACATSALMAGTHSIVASYGGDGSNASSSSSALSQSVSGVNSTTGIATSLTPSTVGTSVTFTATVSGNTPTGTVAFKDGSTSITGCSAASVSGSGNTRTATCITSALGAGSHGVSAAYSGDAMNTGSTSSTLTEMVNQASTSTALVSSANPSAAGTSVTFTASVTGYTPTGTINFTDGAASISGCGAVALTGSGDTRTAQCSTSALTAATHSITASYGGDASNAASSSGVLSQVVNSSTPPTSLVNGGFETPALSSGGYTYNPSASGIGWTFSTSSGIQSNGSAWGAASAPEGVQTAFVQSLGTLSETLTLSAGNYTLSFKAAQRACCVTPYGQPLKITLDGTQVGGLITPVSTTFASFSVTLSIASSGAHTIAFAGTDSSDKTTFIDAVTLTLGTVSAATTTLTSSNNPSRLNRAVTFTATVTGSNPSGAVAFKANGSTIAGCGSVALSGSGNSKKAACTTTLGTSGTYSIIASYGGDAGNAAAASTPLSQIVKARR